MNCQRYKNVYISCFQPFLLAARKYCIAKYNHLFKFFKAFHLLTTELSPLLWLIVSSYLTNKGWDGLSSVLHYQMLNCSCSSSVGFIAIELITGVNWIGCDLSSSVGRYTDLWSLLLKISHMQYLQLLEVTQMLDA